MGLLVESYFTTQEGFVMKNLYLTLDCIRLLKTQGGDSYGCVFIITAYKTRDDKRTGRNPILVPVHLSHVETFVRPDDFFKQTMLGIAYGKVKTQWEANGYVVSNVLEPNQPAPSTYMYDASGFDFTGFNLEGYDREGYDREGFNKDGWDRESYQRDGFNAEGRNRNGYDREGFDVNGYDSTGFDRTGYDAEGFGRDGFNLAGYNRNLLNREGYDHWGYNPEGYDKDGYNKDGYDKNGFDRNGLNREGNSAAFTA
jgi:hypothetical protein